MVIITYKVFDYEDYGIVNEILLFKTSTIQSIEFY